MMLLMVGKMSVMWPNREALEKALIGDRVSERSQHTLVNHTL